MTRQLVLLTVFALSFGGVWFPAGAQEEITPATPAIIDGLRKGAVRYRKAAEQQLDAARQRRDLEAVARTNAMRAIDPLEKRWWLEDLAGYAAKAEELEEYAFNLNLQADDDDSRAARLQAALNAGN
ncbi:MAG: hypothetical protein HYZ40_15290 [Rhodospirillales bacterium]|nr:hypothetical protein [Rhodospirillales bacterium]